MAICELCDTCIFFNDKMPDLPAAAAYLKNKYCRGDFEACARFQIYREFGRENVPAGLFPNEGQMVPEISDGLRRRMQNLQKKG